MSDILEKMDGENRDRYLSAVGRNAAKCSELNPLPSSTKVEDIEAALGRYHEALSGRKHGGVAASAFVHECEVILQRFWNQK